MKSKDLVRLSSRLLHVISNITLDINYSYHVPRDNHMTIDLMTYLPLLKRGVCLKETVNLVIDAYISSLKRSGSTYIKIFSELKSNDITIFDISLFDINRQQNINNIIKDDIYNIEDSFDTMSNDLFNEVIMALTIAYISKRCESSQMPTLTDFITKLGSYYSNLTLDNLYYDNKIKLYVAIIRHKKDTISQYMETIDPRSDNYNAIYLANNILQSTEDHNLMSEIITIMTDNIVIRDWYEKHVLTQGFESSISTSDIPNTLHKYIRGLL